MMKKIKKYAFKIIGLFFFFAFAFYIFSWYGIPERGFTRYGVTFSTVMARQLGLDPRETYDAIVDDLGVRLIRLPVYWSDIEPEEGTYAFSDYDYFFKKAEEKRVQLIPVIGRKLPRWPECFIPSWAGNIEGDRLDEAVRRQMQIVVERYRNSPAVIRWQIENEPFHVYGAECAKTKLSPAIVDEEITLVRSLDAHPIMLTDSGEQGIWSSSLRRAEYLGISTYYQVWNGVLRVVRFPFGPGFYRAKARLFTLFYPDKKIVVSELQAEPWGPGLLPYVQLDFQLRLMDEVRFREIIRRARLAGFEENILWGAEWWWWLKTKQNNNGMWNEAKKIFGG